MNFIVGMLLVSVFITSCCCTSSSRARPGQIQAERRATEAQLQLLQAQIEPHFLFNTLANVLSLIEHDAPRAKLMLESFTDYLRASLGELRREHSSVGAELDMASAYLQLLQLRMDERLRFRIEASEAARRVVVPPLLLQPLIENAIQHGLEPKVEGGEVVVRASVEGDRLRLVVEDNGLGLPAAGAKQPGRWPGAPGAAQRPGAGQHPATPACPPRRAGQPGPGGAEPGHPCHHRDAGGLSPAPRQPPIPPPLCGQAARP